MGDLINPIEIEVAGKKFLISKFDCVSGMRIVTKIPIASLGELISNIKNGVAVNEHLIQAFLEATTFVAVIINKDMHIRLSTEDLTKCHIPEWEDWAKILIKLFEHNCSFFRDGRLQEFLVERSHNIGQSIMKTCTAWLDQLLQKIEPHLTN